MLGFIPDYYKDKNLRDKTVDNYSHALKFVPKYYKTQNNV